MFDEQMSHLRFFICSPWHFHYCKYTSPANKHGNTKVNGRTSLLHPSMSCRSLKRPGKNRRFMFPGGKLGYFIPLPVRAESSVRSCRSIQGWVEKSNHVFLGGCQFLRGFAPNNLKIKSLLGLNFQWIFIPRQVNSVPCRVKYFGGEFMKLMLIIFS